MTDLNWTEKYGNRTLDLKIVVCRVTWENRLYVVSVTGSTSITLKKRYDDLDEAKTACVKLAKKVMADALAALEA